MDQEILFEPKLLVMLAVFFITFAASAIPWIVQRWVFRRLGQIMSFGTCLAAGIVFGAGICHILPDAEEKWETYLRSRNLQTEYPWTAAVAGMTLLLLVSLDFIFVRDETHESRCTVHNESLILNMDSEPESLKEEHEILLETSAFHVGDKLSKPGKAWIFFTALSVHSVFDGLSIGSTTDQAHFYGLLIAILSHKALDGFALGIPIFYAKMGTCSIVSALIFSALTTPFGIFLGMLSTRPHSPLIEAIILSISLGSFLYISLMEMFPMGFQSSDNLAIKISLLWIGWTLMAALAILV